MTEEQKTAFLTFLTYGILFANDLVCDEIALAYNKAKTHPIFRHRVKQLAKKLYREAFITKHGYAKPSASRTTCTSPTATQSLTTTQRTTFKHSTSPPKASSTATE